MLVPDMVQIIRHLPSKWSNSAEVISVLDQMAELSHCVGVAQDVYNDGDSSHGLRNELQQAIMAAAQMIWQNRNKESGKTEDKKQRVRDIAAAISSVVQSMLPDYYKDLLKTRISAYIRMQYPRERPGIETFVQIGLYRGFAYAMKTYRPDKPILDWLYRCVDTTLDPKQFAVIRWHYLQEKELAMNASSDTVVDLRKTVLPSTQLKAQWDIVATVLYDTAGKVIGSLKTEQLDSDAWQDLQMEVWRISIDCCTQKDYFPVNSLFAMVKFIARNRFIDTLRKENTKNQYSQEYYAGDQRGYDPVAHFMSLSRIEGDDLKTDKTQPSGTEDDTDTSEISDTRDGRNPKLLKERKKIIDLVTTWEQQLIETQAKKLRNGMTLAKIRPFLLFYRDRMSLKEIVAEIYGDGIGDFKTKQSKVVRDKDSVKRCAYKDLDIKETAHKYTVRPKDGNNMEAGDTL